MNRKEPKARNTPRVLFILHPCLLGWSRSLIEDNCRDGGADLAVREVCSLRKLSILPKPYTLFPILSNFLRHYCQKA
jgi:hypothetical protein